MNYEESGTLSHTAVKGTLHLTRAARGGTLQPTEAEEIGKEIILTAGDVLCVENSKHHIRNAG